jgi:hypothetical protein
MRFSWLVLGLGLVCGAAHAEPRLPLLAGSDDPVANADAQAMRGTGIGLFVGGLTVTLASQVFTAFAVLSSGCFEPRPQCGTDEMRRQNQDWTIAAAVTTVAGNAMLATGLGLWGTANGRLKHARSRGTLGFAPTPGGAQAGLTIRF